MVGMTGSGKTRFSTGLLEYLRRRNPHAKRYVLDSTEDGFEGVIGKLEVRGNKVPDLIRDPTFTQIWIPDTDVPALYAAWFEKILYKREPAIVLIDEIASIEAEAEEALIKLLKQGRKHGITVINLTQEIANVTSTIFRQMTHMAAFRINEEVYDLSMTRRYLRVPKEEQRQPTSQYGFFYRRTDGIFAMREFPSMQAFFKNTI